MSSIISDIDVPTFDGNGLNIIGTEGMDVLFDSNQDDYLEGLGGNEQILGGNGNDLILAEAGNDDEFIDSNLDNDLMRGGNGDDVITGGEGSDIIYGGLGDDTFEFFPEDLSPSSPDQIVYFQIGEDKLLIKGLSSNDQVTYEPATGQVLVNGQGVINLGDSSEVNIKIDDDGDFEIM